MQKRYLLFIVIITFLLSGSLFAGTYSGGSGTSGDPYQIATASFNVLEKDYNGIKTNKHINLLKYQNKEIVFIDASVPDAENMFKNLNSIVETHRIRAKENGLVRIYETFKGRNKFDAVHIITHSNAG